MIDLHAHILYGVDDGVKTVEESEELIESAIQNGVTDIVFTPHYITDSTFVSSRRENEKKFKILKSKYEDKINLYLGNELYIDENLLENLKKRRVTTLGSSKYLLIELPVCNEYPNLENYLFTLRSKGYKIIIAHPERYEYFKRNFNKALNLLKQGIYFQGNFRSIDGIYGTSTKKNFINLLRHHCYTFLASDVHSKKHDSYIKMNSCRTKLGKVVNDKYLDDLFVNNAKKLLNNEEIEIEFFEKVNFFDRIRGKI